ncbi:MAG TPA: pyridoxal phosphate-dependent aminotransferase [Terriglobales bacterium]|nr:pyridoxal phosphate-dependent aminotransferase [Terriglobales bacterium]
MRLAKRIGLLTGEGALEVYARAKELERAGRPVIHLELGEPDFHPATEVLAAGQRAIAQGRDRYCASRGLPELRTAIAGYLGQTRGVACGAENVLVASGCKLALFLAMMALIEPGDEVLYPEPSFPIYPSVARCFGAHPVAYRLLEANGFQPDIEEVARLATPRTKVLILCSPNNPTGTVYSPAALAGLAQLARERDWWVISDEIYARIVYEKSFASIATVEGMGERTIIIDGFSKSFAMTGWRLGYAVAPLEIIEALDRLVMNTFTCASEFVQVAAIEAIARPEAVTAMVAEYRRRRDVFAGGLDQIRGIACRRPEGAFYAWARVANAKAVQGRLLEEAGVAAIHGRAFGPSGEDYLRFSFAGASGELEEALRRIRCTMNV